MQKQTRHTTTLVALVGIILALQTYLYSAAYGQGCRVPSFNPNILQDRNSPKEVQESFRFYVMTSSRDIFFGDSLYVVVTVENITDEPKKTPLLIIFEEESRAHATLFCEETQRGAYIQANDRFASNFDYPDMGPIEVEPHGRAVILAQCWDFPPIELLQDCFWREVLKSMSPDVIFCNFETMLYGANYYCELTFRPRPENEMSLLVAWAAQATDGFRSQKQGDVENDQSVQNVESSSSENKELSQTESAIQPGASKYLAYLFPRSFKLKPGVLDKPTTVEGWRELENSLSPSTMRDDVKLMRLLLEYYQSEDEEEEEAKLNEFIQWMKDLSFPQRCVYGKHVKSKKFDFFIAPEVKTVTSEDKLKSKRDKLFEALDAISKVPKLGIGTIEE